MKANVLAHVPFNTLLRLEDEITADMHRAKNILRLACLSQEKTAVENEITRRNNNCGSQIGNFADLT